MLCYAMLACAMLCYAVLWHAMLCHASYAEEPEGAPRNRQGHAEEPVKDAAKEPELRGTGQGTRGIGLGARVHSTNPFAQKK